MARVRPFRAWTYARPSADVSDVAAPPYDVISDAQRDALLARSSHNVVALELPEGPLDPTVPGNRYDTGAARWALWTGAQGVLARDDIPAIYVLEQTYTLAGRAIRRRAFITEVQLHAFDEGIVLPHERTLPKALGDRYALLEATGANLSQVFGLYPDPANITGPLFDRATSGAPEITATDDDGVASRVWALTDTELIGEIERALAPHQIFIADGHHRYTTALAYRVARREADAAIGAAKVDPDHDFLMMALVNMDDPDLVVLPTHRVADAAGSFDPEQFYLDLEAHFDVFDLPEGHPSDALEGHATPAFLIRTSADERPRLAVLRDSVDLDAHIRLQRSRAWKHLDVAVLQELVLHPLLGIHPDEPETLERLRFVKDAHDALGMTGTHDVAFILRPTRMDQMREVALAGETMPQKSTYFYPKLRSGLVLRGME